MNKFVEIPATNRSLSKRKPVYGVGINDADYIVQPVIDGKRFRCPYYFVWKSMLKRCYCPKFQKRQPSYIGCSVAKEWLTFSNFRSWMKTQYWEGRQLDKDILIAGNKIYGPNACLFVSGAINMLLNDQSGERGEYPRGVCFDRHAGKYKANCMINGKKKHLGLFVTVPEAEKAYLTFKSYLIKKVAFDKESVINPKLQEALLTHSDIFKRKGDDVGA